METLISTEKKHKTSLIDEFKQEVSEGLNASPKYLSSKYFYVKKGDALFQQIMQMPEYYLTNCELEIFSYLTANIINAFQVDKKQPFELIELGAGDGTKTKKLIAHLVDKDYAFDYLPIDISQNALDKLKASLSAELPKLSIQTQQGEYFGVLDSLMASNKPKIVLFIGSNLGNLSDEQAQKFIKQLASKLKKGDKLLLGVDLIKAESIVLPAYNDAAGITKAFNLNLLDRMNRELGANFDLNQFEHRPSYSEDTGITKSFLKSKIKQSVYIDCLKQSFELKKGEQIQTEMSRKYNDEIIHKIIAQTDFRVTNKFMDSKRYFADYLLTIA